MIAHLGLLHQGTTYNTADVATVAMALPPQQLDHRCRTMLPEWYKELLEVVTDDNTDHSSVEVTHATKRWRGALPSRDGNLVHLTSHSPTSTTCSWSLELQTVEPRVCDEVATPIATIAGVKRMQSALEEAIRSKSRAATAVTKGDFAAAERCYVHAARRASVILLIDAGDHRRDTAADDLVATAIEVGVTSVSNSALMVLRRFDMGGNRDASSWRDTCRRTSRHCTRALTLLQLVASNQLPSPLSWRVGASPQPSTVLRWKLRLRLVMLHRKCDDDDDARRWLNILRDDWNCYAQGQRREESSWTMPLGGPVRETYDAIMAEARALHTPMELFV